MFPWLQVVNLHSNRVSRILGKVENTERFLRIALHQGGIAASSKSRKAASLAPNSQDTKAPVVDPTLICCAFKKHRLYLFRYSACPKTLTFQTSES